MISKNVSQLMLIGTLFFQVLPYEHVIGSDDQYALDSGGKERGQI